MVQSASYSTRPAQALLAIIMAALLALGLLPLGYTPQAHAQECGPMDVAFVIDDTGSMGGAIGNVQTEAANIVDDINTASGGDYQLGLVTFKDTVEIDVPLAPMNGAAVQAALLALVADGGGNEPEASDEALNTVINGPGFGTFRAGAVKIIILITDAHPGGFDDTFTPGVDDVNAHARAEEAAAADILISAVYVPTAGVVPTIQAIMQDYAATTGGVYIETAADGSGTAAAIQSVIAACGENGDIPTITNTNTNTDTATNVAASTQSGVAVSGDATAFDDSTAASGEAVAVTESYQSQAIIQVKLNQAVIGCECEVPEPGPGDTTNDNTNDATAANAAGSTQAAAAVTGIAYAEDTSGGFTGPAFVAGVNAQQQFTAQVDGNQVIVGIPSPTPTP